MEMDMEKNMKDVGLMKKREESMRTKREIGGGEPGTPLCIYVILTCRDLNS